MINVCLKFLAFLFIFLCFSCEKVAKNNNEVDFCSVIDSPQKYQSKIIQTKAIVLGYHTLIFYSEKCLEQEKVVALEMNYEDRQNIGEAKLNSNRTYQKDFLNNNLYAEISVLGELKENDEENELEIYHPKYKFFVKKIKEVNILSKEIYPSKETMGAKIINISQ